MVNVVGSKDNYDRFKPAKLKNYLTMAQLCERVGRTSDRIKQLEKQGRIPSPIRVRLGKLEGIRLYSPKEVALIEKHFKNARPGPIRK